MTTTESTDQIHKLPTAAELREEQINGNELVQKQLSDITVQLRKAAGEGKTDLLLPRLTTIVLRELEAAGYKCVFYPASRSEGTSNQWVISW